MPLLPFQKQFLSWAMKQVCGGGGRGAGLATLSIPAAAHTVLNRMVATSVTACPHTQTRMHSHTRTHAHTRMHSTRTHTHSHTRMHTQEQGPIRGGVLADEMGMGKVGRVGFANQVCLHLEAGAGAAPHVATGVARGEQPGHSSRLITPLCGVSYPAPSWSLPRHTECPQVQKTCRGRPPRSH